MRAIIVFVAIAYALSAALSYFVWTTGGHESPYTGYGLLAMFFPFIAVVVVRLTMKEKVYSMGWGRFPLLYLPVALFIFPLILHTVMLPLLYHFEGGLPWASWLTPDANGIYHADEAKGWGDITQDVLIKRIALNAGVGLLIVTVLAFFEEIGWRAWLLPRLAERMGMKTAVVLGAVLWAFWHTPFALSGIHFIPTVPTDQLLFILPILHVGAGLILGWLWFRTQSIWIASLAHGALNNWGQYALKYMAGTGEGDPIVLAAGGAGLIVVGAVLLMGLKDEGARA